MATEFESEQTSPPFETRSEGPTTRATEAVTSRVPSGAYLTAAVGAMAASATLQILGKRTLSLFIGQWAPSILIMGLYNKLVKVAGSD
jgi:hypothetical protein